MLRTNPSSTPTSPAASSLPELSSPSSLCAIHQPNFMPRLTTLAKLFASDHWIVLDDVQFARRDYQHRARIATLDGLGPNRWLTIPTHRPSGRATLVRDTLIADRAAARRRASSILRQQYGTRPHWPALDRALQPVWNAFDTGRAAPVATASTRALLELLGWDSPLGCSPRRSPAGTRRRRRRRRARYRSSASPGRASRPEAEGPPLGGRLLAPDRQGPHTARSSAHPPHWRTSAPRRSSWTNAWVTSTVRCRRVMPTSRQACANASCSASPNNGRRHLMLASRCAHVRRWPRWTGCSMLVHATESLQTGVRQRCRAPGV
ncbi:WbqC-like protein family protein [Streptomyces sp. OspMP-M43]|nr:WbqC-like protein family protein [Streptomyces sp. OspMP-M43]